MGCDVKQPTILYDGYCNLCSGVVNSILLYDRKKRFRFSPLQSPFGATVQGRLKAKYGAVPDSIVLVQDNKVYIKSDAVLRIAAIVGGPWYFLLPAWMLPRKARNWFYDVVARKRYRWFGQRSACHLPEEGHAYRFLTKEEGLPESQDAPGST